METYAAYHFFTIIINEVKRILMCPLVFMQLSIYGIKSLPASWDYWVKIYGFLSHVNVGCHSLQADLVFFLPSCK